MTDVHDISALTRTGPIPVQPTAVVRQDDEQHAPSRPSGIGDDTAR